MNKINWNFDNTYSNLPESFISKTSPIPVKSPELVIFNYNLAKELSLDFSLTDKKDLSKLFSGNLLPRLYCNSASLCWTSIWPLYYAWGW